MPRVFVSGPCDMRTRNNLDNARVAQACRCLWAPLIVEVVNKGARELGRTMGFCTTSGYMAYRWAQGPLKDASTTRSWIKAESSV